jgi:hypothetical protein
MNTTHFRITTPHLFKRIFHTNLRQIMSDLLSHMTVQKILILASLLLVLLFDVFHFATDPTSMAPVGSMGFEIGRVLVAVLLLFLFFTNPPRSLKVRSLLGIAACAMSVIALQSLFTYQIGVIDCVLYLEVAIIVGLEALEPQRRVRTARYMNAGFKPSQAKG